MLYRYLPIILFAFFFYSSGGVDKSYSQNSSETTKIEEILVEGNRRVSIGTVESYFPIKEGDSISQSTLDSALEQLYKTELFQNISLDIRGSTLIVSIVENPVINQVNIEGNDAISDEKLLEALNVQPRRVYNRKVAIDATQKLLEIYRTSGRYGAVVKPKIIKLEENRIDLVFEVNEGPLILIKSITFSGNEAFSDRKLRQVIASRQKRWWAFLASNDKYDESRLDYDVRLLRQFYLARGYADIDVQRVRGGLLPDRSGFVITFIVNEGVRYKVDKIKINSGIKGFDSAELVELIEFDDDRWYDVRQLEEGLLNISEKYGSIGYPFVNVSPEILTDPETGKLEILITVDKARRNFVERIEFIDNARTMDKVIRREFEIVEGDAYNKLKLDRSIRNVRNLGFFSDVKVDTVQGSNPDQSITRVTVQEQATGDFSIGVGYSSLDKTAFSFGINERNFLGTGRRLKTSLSLSSAKTNFTVGVSEPYLLGRNLLGSFDVFKEEDKDDETTVKRTGMIFGVGFSAADDVYHRLSYELSQSKTSISSTTATSVTGEEGKTLVQASVDYTLGKDKRDSRFDPTEGYFIELNESLAGFGGDVKFLRSELLASYYKPVMFSSVILGISGKVGHITGLDGEKVTQSQRFFLGGRDVRGFTGSGIGPRDTGSGSAVGGNKMFAGRMEILSNIGLNRDTGLRWTIFNDFGALWDTDYPSGVTKPNTSNYRASIGFGVYWNTAIGPLSFSWATPYNKESHDKTKIFQFNIGTRL